MSTVTVKNTAGTTIATYTNCTVTREPFSTEYPDSDVLIVSWETGTSPVTPHKAVHRIAPGMSYAIDG